MTLKPRYLNSRSSGRVLEKKQCIFRKENTVLLVAGEPIRVNGFGGLDCTRLSESSMSLKLFTVIFLANHKEKIREYSVFSFNRTTHLQ